MYGLTHFALEMETLDVIYVNIWSILISLANLLILYFILKKLLFKPVVKVVSEREKKVKDLLDNAETAKTEAEQTRTVYEEKLAHADEEAAEVVSRANARANRQSDEIVGEAKARAAALLTKADADIAQERKKALNELKDEISDLSVEIAEKVVAREIKADDHHRLIDDFIREVGEDNHE